MKEIEILIQCGLSHHYESQSVLFIAKLSYLLARLWSKVENWRVWAYGFLRELFQCPVPVECCFLTLFINYYLHQCEIQR